MVIRPASAGVAGSRSPSRKSPGDFSKPDAERSPGKNPLGVVGDVGSLFFPQSQALGIAPDDTVSPGVLRKMVYAGSHASSFQQASRDLKEEAELDISDQRIMRATKRIGQERVAERDAATQAWVELPLPERQASPREQVPQVACVEMDGGRLQIRDRKVSEEERRRTKKAAALVVLHPSESRRLAHEHGYQTFRTGRGRFAHREGAIAYRARWITWPIDSERPWGWCTRCCCN